MVETEVKKKGFGTTRWVWVLVALAAVFVAMTMSSSTSPRIALFGAIDRACQCARGTQKYSGMVEDCCCDYETVDQINEEVLYPSLQELVKTPFFRYFKLVIVDPFGFALALLYNVQCMVFVIILYFYEFTQQNLPACKPVLTPAAVIATFLLMGFIFIPVGLVTLRASNSVVELVDRYDIEYIPEEFRSNKVAYIKDDSISKNCSRFIKVLKPMKAPIYIYYQLDNYYQNHRRYVKSRSDQQLLHGLDYNETSSCKPVQFSDGQPIVPCGLIAWSLFNDTYRFSRGPSELKVNRKNIAWKSDRDHKFGKQVYPYNFQNGTLIGGGKLDPHVPLSDQEDLLVWMRTAALPSFRKLYGKIDEDLDVDDVIVVRVMNNYNTYSFGGKKKLVLSTSSWLGGKNDFLGLANIFVGSFCILISIIFLLLHVKNPRPYGETSYSSWSK